MNRMETVLTATCSVCHGEREVVVNSFQAGDQTAEEWGPCPACSATEGTDVVPNRDDPASSGGTKGKGAE